jgi:hypothetical protein
VTDGAFDVDALIATAAPLTAEVEVCGRGDLVERHNQLVRDLHAAEQAGGTSISGNPEVRRLAEEIVQVEDEQAASRVRFKFKSLSRQAWNDLLAQHPPHKGENLGFHDATFVPAAVAACCMHPGLTVEQATALRASLPGGEWDKIEKAVSTLNRVSTPAPKLPAAIEIARANGNSSISQRPSTSPAPSSSGANGEQ